MQHTGSLIIFDEFAVLVYYEVMKHASNYDSIDFFFDQNLEKNSSKGQDLFGEKVDSTCLKGILLKLLKKWLRFSSKPTKFAFEIAFEIARTSPGWSDYDCNI